MIVCSCAVISDDDIEQALVEILSQPDAPLPTPGVVYRHLQKKMVCCGCSAAGGRARSTRRSTSWPSKGVVCPYACACAQGRLLKCASDTPAMRLIERALRAPEPAPAATTHPFPRWRRPDRLPRLRESQARGKPAATRFGFRVCPAACRANAQAFVGDIAPTKGMGPSCWRSGSPTTRCTGDGSAASARLSASSGLSGLPHDRQR